jgi:hypothetical protein
MISKLLRGGAFAFTALSLFTASLPLESQAGSPPNDRPRYGRIVGYKFEDLNRNGRDDSEPRLSGWTIRLTSLGPISVNRTTTTDEDGEFSFRGLPLQRYRVCEVIPDATPPWVPTTPECFTVHLSRGVVFASVAFGNTRDENGYEGCTRTQGYWGNAPAGQARLRELVPGTLSLGTISYTADQLLAILATPDGGNAVIKLAHQLIAAKLNILNGASSTPIAATIALADTALDALIIPPVGTAYVDPSSELGQRMVSLAGTLDLYNNGLLGVPHCE